MRIEGTIIPEWLFQTEKQQEIGPETYDAGAEILRGFFQEQIGTFLQPELRDLGQRIIKCCLNGGDLEDYEQLIETSHV